MERLKTLSLFCGCGGMDLGLTGGFKYLSKTYSPNPVEIVFSTDYDPYSVKIYNHNFSHQAYLKDIKEIQSKKLPDHNILIGGFPCQSFSIIAQNPPRLGINDDTGKLFFEICRILKDKKPRFFIAENVKGIFSANKKKAFPLILKEFKNSGYLIKYKLLNSSHYEVPQKRERVFIVGFREKEDFLKFSFPAPLTEKEPPPLRSAIEKDIEKKYFFSERRFKECYEQKEK